MSEIPEPWAGALTKAGFTDPRNDERPSWSALSRSINVHTSTLSAMSHGARDTSQEILDRVASALRVDPRLVAEWVGRVRSERSPYIPPSDAHLLDREERDAVDRLITLLARSKKQRSSDRDDSAERTNTPAPASKFARLSPKQLRLLEQAQPVTQAAYDGSDPTT